MLEGTKVEGTTVRAREGTKASDLLEPEIVQAVARAHDATGDPAQALAWARKIGSDAKVASKDDFRAQWPVEQRIGALAGVAEGILDRQSGRPTIEK
jgi:hypothetical protein